MKTALTVFFSGLAFAAAVTLVAARSPSHEAATASPAAPSAFAQVVDDRGPVQVLVFAPLYGSSPRIIHVPQRSDRTDASANPSDADINADNFDDNVPSPREPLVKRIKRAPVGPAAPAASTEGKTSEALSPVYPTPRYNGDAGAKDAAPNASGENEAPPPPIGYTPPSSVAPHN